MAVKSFDKANSANRQIDILKDFSGGLNTELADSATKDNQFRKLTNFDIDKAGSLMKRPGLYKVPYVEKLLNRRLEDAINNNEILIDNQPVNKTQFQIQECIPFFDGIHWVYNYITTFGVFVILLDKNMNIPTDIGDLDLTTDDYKVIAQFYPIDKSTISASTNTFKITKYNDQYIMYKTLYQVNFSLTTNINKRQVVVYSWNPIYNENYVGHNLPNDILYPQWLEASWDKDNIVSDTSFGEVEFVKEDSKYISSLLEYDNLVDLNVKSVAKKYVVDPNGFLDKYDIKVTYKPSTPYAQLVIKRKLKTESEYKEFSIELKHQNGDPITDEQISNIYLYNANIIQINLIENVRYNNKFDISFKKGFLDDDRKIPISNNIEIFNNILKSTIKWFWVNLDFSDVNEALVYSYSITQQYQTPNFTNQMVQEAINVYDQFDSNKRYHWVDAINWGQDGAFKSTKNAKDFQVTMVDYINNYSISRANRIYFTDIGAPYSYSYQYVDTTSVHNRQHLKFIEHVSNTSKGVINITDDTISNRVTTTGETGWDSRYSLSDLSNDKFLEFQNLISKNINQYHGLNFLRRWEESKESQDKQTTYKISNLVAFHFPAIAAIKKIRTIFLSAGINQYSYSLRPIGVIVYTLPEIDSNYDIAKNKGFSNVREMYLTFSQHQLTKYSFTHVNKLFYSGNSDFDSMVPSKHLINEDQNYFGFGNALYTIFTKDDKRYTISAATMNNNSFEFINPFSQDFINSLVQNNFAGLNISAIEKQLTPLELFGQEMLDTFRKTYYEYVVSKFVNPKLFLSYRFSNDAREKFIDLQLSTSELMDKLVRESINYNARLFTLRYLFSKGSDGTSITPLSFEITFTPMFESTPITLISLDEITKIVGTDVHWIDFFNSIKFAFSGKLLLSENSGNQIVNFKQQIYTKPTLNDIVNIWYNLILFSKFATDQDTDSRQPDIYNSKDHPYISNQLMEYPNTNLQPQYSSIQLFGLQPVNDLITNVGTQRFQLFYALNDGKTEEDFKVALTTMSISDYNAMINSSDYSTDVVEGENKKTPNWTDWSVLFNISTNKKGVAIFELEVPSTTSPYLILVQVAEKNKDDPKKTINLATLVETRIELQPSNNSSSNKLNINAIFDEFVLSNKLVSYSSNLISYGNSNKIFFNEISNATYFPLSRIVELKTPEAVKSANVFQNKLIISTENSKFYIGGSSFDSSTDPFYLREIASDSGVLAPKSDIPMGNYLYFLDTTGIKILKNLYGTADKEFAFESIDTIIKSIVAKDKDACAATLDNKYFICFPNYKYMLVYHFDYKAWVSYESAYFNFSTMFVNDGELYGVDRDNFKIFKFDNNVYVDNWNEVEEWYELYKGKVTKFGGYVKTPTVDDQEVEVQQGAPITCELETKQLDQDYTPHRKKYDYVLISSYLEHDDIKQQNFGASLKPIIKVDNNLINYKFSIVKDNNVYNYVEENNSISIRENSSLNATATLNKNRLGLNSLNNYYYVPVKRKGNTLSIGFKFDAPTNINIDSLYIRYGLTKVKKSRGGIS